jgi:predicted Kef-type K+ transport protein
MDFDWVATGPLEVSWLALALIMGLGARAVRLPPLVGYLAAGFLLSWQGVTESELIQVLSDLGITLLLFTVGLKLNLRTLARPQVWAVTSLHMTIVIALFGLAIWLLSALAVPMLSGISVRSAFLIAFALSFSSTVFVVKVLEERGEMAALHGRIAVGILLMQDIAAVVFLAFSTGAPPSIWALALLALIPARHILHMVLQRIGHGELLLIYGFVLALGGAELFELVGLKGDLGALVLGVLIASHRKAEELAKGMMNFKDLFLVGFFLSIGIAQPLGGEPVLVGLAIVPLVFVKSALFFGILTRFRLRARTALSASINLTNYSEFGLIVAAIGATNGWIDADWLIVLAIGLSVSFAIAAAMSAVSEKIYTRYRTSWKKFQRDNLIADDRLLDLGGATIAVIGMGGIGTGAYDTLRSHHGDTVVGVDIDPVTARNQRALGRNVLRGDPSDADFWDRVQASHTLDLVMLALPSQSTTLAVVDRLADAEFTGRVAAVAKFEDEVEALKQAGATTVFNMYAEAGVGFVAHVMNELPTDVASNSPATEF